MKINHHLQCSFHSHPIYYLRHTELDTQLMYQLASILLAYRPHDPIPTKDELGDKVTRTTCNPFN